MRGLVPEANLNKKKMMMKINNRDFVHIHNHTEFSSFDGLNKMSDFPTLARKMGFKALGITDHGTVGGLIKFFQECTKTIDKNGNKIEYDPIVPLLGSEFYLSRDRFAKSNKEQIDGRKGNRHIVLLAKNWQGFQNLCTLSEKSWTEGFYNDPRIDFSLLEKYHEGIICSSACLSSIVNNNLLHGRYDQARKAAIKLKDIFNDDFYFEVMYHGLDAERYIIPDIFKLADSLNIKVVASNDCFVAGTMICSQNGMIPIENISKRDLVLTHKNRFSSVEFTNQRVVDKTFVVKTVLGTSAFEATAEHPVLTVHRIGTKFSEPEWKNISSITNSDYLLLHKNYSKKQAYVSTEDIESIYIPGIIGDKYNSDILEDSYYFTQQGFGGRKGRIKIPTNLELCDDLLFIIGRFIAEGHSDSYSHQIGFAANCLEKHIQDRIESYFAKFGVTSYRPEKDKDCKLVFTSKIFKALFTSLCGIGAENKHLPIIDGSYFTYSRRQMLKILEGYVGGDGHISIKPDTPSVLCATTSRLLAYQISDVLHALDFISLPTVRNHSKAKHKNPKANPKNWLPLYVLHMSEIDIKPFCNLINIKRDIIETKKVSRRKFIDIGDYFAVKVKSVIENTEQKVVYNIQVLEDESYTANSYIVHNCHYSCKSDGASQEVLMCMSTSRCVNDSKRLKFPYHEFYLKSAEEMASIFSDRMDCIYNTLDIPAKVDHMDISRNFGGMRLPKFPLPENFSDPHDYLEYVAWEGLKEMGSGGSQKHIDRLRLELDDVKIAKLNNSYDFATYFLIVRDYIQFAKTNGILTGCGRGSGFGSLLLKTLGITYGVDPIEHDLLWERFLGFDTKKFIKEQDFV